MSELSTEVRDHNQPCEHAGEFGARKVITRTDRYDASTEYVFWTCGTCAGGKRYRIDLEAAYNELIRLSLEGLPISQTEYEGWAKTIVACGMRSEA